MMRFKAVQRNLFSPRNGVAAFCTVLLVGLTYKAQSAKMTSLIAVFITMCMGLA